MGKANPENWKKTKQEIYILTLSTSGIKALDKKLSFATSLTVNQGNF